MLWFVGVPLISENHQYPAALNSETSLYGDSPGRTWHAGGEVYSPP